MDRNNWRGKGVSKTKFTKAGEPKHAGNFSAVTIHHDSLQYREYYVRLLTSESGVEILIVGDHTPLATIMGENVATLAMRDEHFYSYRQVGEYGAIGNGRTYEANRTLHKINHRSSWKCDTRAFVLREEIYTDGDFTYRFPDY